jgi:hypothetical protein
MSDSSPPRLGYRPTAKLERMPFGKYKGLPFGRVPTEYAAWLVNRDIDDRLRQALKGVGAEAARHPSGDGAATVHAPVGDEAGIIADFLTAREQAAAAKRRLSDLREQLISLLDKRGGACVDEAGGQRISIEERPRWEYDPAVVHRLVDDGRLDELQFAQALVTSVDKNAVTGWVQEGLVTEDQVAELNARVVTRMLRQVCVKPLASR